MVDRIKHLSLSLEQLVSLGSKEEMVREYANVKVARDHEFNGRESKRRYAAMVYAIGAFTYGDDFCEEAGVALFEAERQQIEDSKAEA